MPFISIQSNSRTIASVPLVIEEFQRTASYFTNDNEAIGSYDQQAFLTDDGLTMFVRMSLADGNVIQVYRYNAGDWVYESSIAPPVPSYSFAYTGFVSGYGDQTNFSASSDGNYVIACDPDHNNYTGGAHIFHFNGTTWDLQTTITSDPSITEERSGIYGQQVGMSHDGSRVFVVNGYVVLETQPFNFTTYGAGHSDIPTNLSSSNFILVYDRVGSPSWSFSDVIRPSLSGSGAVTISGNGNIIVAEVGSTYTNYDSAETRTQLNVYEYSGGNWVYRDGLFPGQGGKDSPTSSFVRTSFNGSTIFYFGDEYLDPDLSRLNSVDDFEGIGYIYERSGNLWNYATTIVPSLYQQSPTAATISSDGQTVIIGRAMASVPFMPPTGGVGGYGAYTQGTFSIYKKVTSGEWKYIRDIPCPHDISTSSSFGFSVSLTGDGRRLLIGDGATINSADPQPDWFNWYGSFHVYDLLPYQEPTREFWGTQQTVLDPAPVALAQFGAGGTISGDGNTLAVVSFETNAIEIYTKISNTWTHQSTLASPVVGHVGFTGGVHLSTNGNTLATISHGTNTQPVIFERSTGVWNAGTTITEYTTYFAPMCLSDDGNRLAIKAQIETVEGPEPWYILVYFKDNIDPTVWTFNAVLPLVDAIEVVNAGTLSMDMTGDKILLSSKGDITNSEEFCRASLFDYGGSPPIWTRTNVFVHPLNIYDVYSQFGHSGVISADGTTIAVADPVTGSELGFNDSTIIHGTNTVHVFRKNSLGQWFQEAILRSPVQSGLMEVHVKDISADGNIIVMTATAANGSDTVGTGAAYMWSYLPVSPGYPDIKNWVMSQEITLSGVTAAAFDQLGAASALSQDGTALVVTAPGYDATGVAVVHQKQTRPVDYPLQWSLYAGYAKQTGSYTLPDTWGKHLAAPRAGNLFATSSGQATGPTTRWVPDVYAIHGKDPLALDQLWLDQAGLNAGQYGISMSDDALSSVVVASVIDTIGTSNFLAVWTRGTYGYQTPDQLAAPANTEFRHVVISGNGTVIFVTLYDTTLSEYTSIRRYVLNSGTGNWDLSYTIVPDPLTYATRANFGTSLATSYDGTKLAAGAPSTATADSSYLYVYEWNGTAMAEAFSGNMGSAIPCLFGQSVTMDSAGTKIVVGDPTNEKAYLYQDTTGWTNTHTFDIQTSYAGISTGSSFGEAVSLSGNGNILAVGAPTSTSVGSPGLFVNGAVLVYRLVSNVWRLEDALFDYQTLTQTNFGAGVAVNQTGTVIYVGAPTHLDFTVAPATNQRGIITMWTNPSYERQEAGPRQLPNATPTLTMYTTKRLVNVNEQFEIKLEVTNRTQQTITNLDITIMEVNCENLIDKVDTVDHGSLLVIGSPASLVWSIPSLAPGVKRTFTRSAKQPDTHYGVNVSLYTTNVTSDQVPSIHPLFFNSPYYTSGGDASNISFIASSKVCVMSKFYCYTVGPLELLCQTAWTNDGTLMMAPGSSSVNGYGIPQLNQFTDPGAYCVDRYVDRASQFYATLKPAVAPNGKFVVFPTIVADGGLVGTAPTHPTELVVCKRDLVGTIKRVDRVFENPSDSPTYKPNNIAISPDANATYMAYCGSYPGGFRVYKKDPTDFKWTLLPPLPGAPDGEPMYATWSDDTQYLAVACRSGTRSWYAWKLDTLTDTWTDLSFVNRLNGTNEYGVAKFSKSASGRHVLFIGPSWDVSRFDIRTSAGAPFGDVSSAEDIVNVGGYWNNGDTVRYSKEGQNPAYAIGLTDNTNYYVRRTYIGNTGQKLAFYTSRADALADTGRIALTPYAVDALHYFHTGYEGVIEGKGGGTYLYLLDSNTDTFTLLDGLRCLKDLQTNGDYVGRFTGGAGYTTNQIIYLQEGTRVSVTAVSSGVVTAFEIEKWNASKRGHPPGATISDSAGGGFSITPNAGNEIPHCTGGAITDATWSDDYLVIGRASIGYPWTTNEDSAYLEIFQRSGTYGEVLSMFTGTVMDDPLYPGSDGYPLPILPKWSTQMGRQVTNASISNTNRINFPSGTTGYSIGDVVALKSSSGALYDAGMYTIISKTATYVTVNYEIDNVPISGNGWVNGATNCTASVLSNSPYAPVSSPRTLEFNHDGTFLAVGGGSWEFGEPLHYPYLNTEYTQGRLINRVYKVNPADSNATFQRLLDIYHYEVPDTGLPDPIDGPIPVGQLYWWKRFNEWIGVWPGYMSAPYYNATDWSVNDTVPVPLTPSLTYGRSFYDENYVDSLGGSIHNGWLQDGTRNKGTTVDNNFSAIDGFKGSASGLGMWKGNHNGTVLDGDIDRYDTLKLNLDYTNEFLIRCWMRLDSGFTRTDTDPAKFMRLNNPGSPTTHDFYLTATNTTGLSNGGTINGVALTTYAGNATNDYSALSSGWHRIEYYVNKSLGVLKVWQDGVLTRNETGLNFGASPLTTFYLVSEFVGTHDATNYYYFDDIQVYTDKSSGAFHTMSDATVFVVGDVYLEFSDITINSNHLTGWASVVHGELSDYASCTDTAVQTIVSSTSTSITYTPVALLTTYQYVYEYVLDAGNNVLQIRQIQNGNL